MRVPTFTMRLALMVVLMSAVFQPVMAKQPAQTMVENTNAVLVRSGSWLGRVVDEIVCEQLFEQGKVAPSLHLLGIRTDNGLGLFRGSAAGHGWLREEGRAVGGGSVGG